MLFSIIIPTFNDAKYLKKALYSLDQQTSKNFELIIIDNSSEDETEKVINNSNIKNLLVKKINNKGIIAKSRNFGMDLSKGDWLIFLDSDDIFYHNKIEFLEKNISTDYDIYCSSENLLFSSTGKKKIYNSGPYEEDFYKKLLINGNRLSTSSSVIKKKFLQNKNLKFDEKPDFITAEDYDFFLNAVKFGAKIKFFKDILGERTIRNDSQSSDYKKHRNAVSNVLKYHINFIQDFTSNKKKLWKKVVWRIYVMDLQNLLTKKKYFKAFKIIIKIVFNSPVDFFKFVFKKLYSIASGL